MGFSHEAYVAYGLRVPVRPYVYDENGHSVGQQVSHALSVPTVKAACPDVGHLEAGAYDNDMFFLVTYSQSAQLGEYHRLDEFTHHQLTGWDEQLANALHVLGWDRLYPDLKSPCWFVVADQS